MTEKTLNTFAAIAGSVAALSVFVVFVFSGSQVADTIFRFQTLLTGVLAGLSALIGAGFVYRSAKLPIDAAKELKIAHRIAMEKAGSAVLLGSVSSIYSTVLMVGSRPRNELPEKPVVPQITPDLKTIATQPDDIIEMLAEFFTDATIMEAQIFANSWENDDDGYFGSLDELEASYNPLLDRLKEIAYGEEI